MKNIKWYFVVFVTTIFITQISFAQDYEEPPKAPKLLDYSRVKPQDEKLILSKLSPELKAALLKVKEVDQERYEELLEQSSYNSFDMYSGFMEASERERMETDRQIEEMEIQTEALGIQYEHASSENDKQKIVTDLKHILGQLFDMKEKSRSLEVEMLEKELKQLKESLNVRKQSKNEIINRRLNELIGKGDYLDW